MFFFQLEICGDLWTDLLSSVLDFCCLGRAYFALGKKGDALSIWEKGYQCALCQSADLKQLLELEELLTTEKQDNNIVENGAVKSGLSTVVFETGVTDVNRKLSKTNNSENKLIERPDFCMKSSDSSGVCSSSGDNLVVCEGKSEEVVQNQNINCENKGCNDDSYRLSDASKLHDLRSETSGFCSKSKITAFHSKSSDSTDIVSKPSKKSDARANIGDEAKRTKKFSVAKISKTKSISVDFRLSRGISEVYMLCSSKDEVFHIILKKHVMCFRILIFSRLTS